MKVSLLVIALLIGCNSSGPLAVVPENDALKITNGTNAAIYYFVVERQTAALINWAPCTDPAACRKVVAHGMAQVPFNQITGYEPGEHEAIFHWWHLVPAAAGFRVDSIRSQVVPL